LQDYGFTLTIRNHFKPFTTRVPVNLPMIRSAKKNVAQFIIYDIEIFISQYSYLNTRNFLDFLYWEDLNGTTLVKNY